MRYAALLILPLLLSLIPSQAFAASTWISSTSANVTSATSLSFNINDTGANLVVINVEARLTTGGCSTSDVTNLAVTVGGSAATIDKGSSTGGVSGPAGSCVFGYVFHIQSPPTGAATAVSLTWTGTAGIAAAAIAYSGANGGIGTITQSSATGDFTLSQTITSSDLLEGALSVADICANFTLANSHTTCSADSGGNVGVGAETNSGTGSVTVNGTYGVGGRLFFSIIILGTAPVSSNALVPDDF